MKAKDISELSKKDLLDAQSDYLDYLEQDESIPIPEVSEDREERQKEIDKQRKRLQAEKRKVDKEQARNKRREMAKAKKQKRQEISEARYQAKLQRINAKNKAEQLKQAAKMGETLRNIKLFRMISLMVIVVIFVAFCNPSVRERAAIVTRHLAEFVQSLLSGEPTTSNKAADTLMDLGKELNEINGYDGDSNTGFDIDKAD